MKVLLCHNRYQQPGGEDRVFEAEANLLESRGHQVVRFERHNDEIRSMSKSEAFRNALWSRESEQALDALIARERPAVMHCANTFPLISPSAYSAAKRHGVAVVQTLHNYRLICPNAQLFRENAHCEDCLGKTVAWPALQHGCYRGGRGATAAVVSMLAFHSLRRTWGNDVDRYVAISGFLREKLISGGLPAEKIVVKPNFVEVDTGPGGGGGNYALYVGRLSPEKGVETLLEAWRLLPDGIELKVAGQGPLEPVVREAARSDNRISFLGQRSPEDIYALMGDAKFLVMPSVWAEPFGLTVIEAFAKGTPVLASRVGALTEMVREEETGALFEPGNAENLAASIRNILSSPVLSSKMRCAARAEFETRYDRDANYEQLVNVYREAINVKRAGTVPLANAPIAST